MSKDAQISPDEAADRRAIREFVEAYAHCADRGDAKVHKLSSPPILASSPESDGDRWAMGPILRRLEGVAKRGATYLSEDAYRQVKGHFDLKVTDLGATQLKNIAEPGHVYTTRSRAAGRDKAKRGRVQATLDLDAARRDKRPLCCSPVHGRRPRRENQSGHGGEQRAHILACLGDAPYTAPSWTGARCSKPRAAAGEKHWPDRRVSGVLDSFCSITSLWALPMYCVV
jgi:hypothetical protein